MFHLTKGLIPLWSYEFVNTAFTDAVLSVNKPEKAGTVMTFDAKWEGNSTNFFTVFKDGDIYRMYYETWDFVSPDVEPCINVCYAESTDAVHWHRPNLGIFEINGSRDNNVIMTNIPDNITVVKDTNPDCPLQYRYKAVMDGFIQDANGKQLKALVIKTSADGIRFTQTGHVNTGYDYDSQNTLHWNEHTRKYYCYFRNNIRNRADVGKFRETTLREIMVTESFDCVNWSDPVPLDYMGGETYPLYTNCISAYPYDTRYYIGFPTRYAERREWSSNFEQLAAKDFRLERMKLSRRYGLATTDCVFMSSSDNVHWHRFDEATLTPGPENDSNWVYGDCYPAVGGVIETPPRFEGDFPELSVFAGIKNRKNTNLIELVRYVYRIDGFASFKADYSVKTLRTKPFTFDAETLSLNFRTSCRGCIYITLLDERNNVIDGYTSCELFGDSLSRKIEFDKPLSKLCGKTVSLEFKMCDAEIYSVRFS